MEGFRPARLSVVDEVPAHPTDGGPGEPPAEWWNNGRQDGAPPLKLDVVRPSRWAGLDVPKREWIVPDLIPVGGVTMLSGDGALGKSLLMAQLLGSTATGSDWLGLPTMKCRSLAMFCEDEEAELHRRLANVSDDLRVDLSGLDDVALLLRVAEDNALMTFDARTERGSTTPLYGALRDAVLETGSRLIVLDALHDVFAGNENSRPQARQFIQSLRRVALDVNGAVVLCAHPSLSGMNSGSGASGSTAWNNAVRSRLYLERPEALDGEPPDPNARVLRTKKANYSSLGDEITMRWEQGVFVADAPPSAFQRAGREQAAEMAFLDCLAMAAKRGNPASSSKNSPERFAPKLFRTMPPGRGFKVGEFQAAMDRLFEAEKISIGSTKGVDRHEIKCIVRGPK